MNSLASWVDLVELAAGVTELALQWLVQSAIVIAAGLSAACLLRRRAPALRSAVYQTTLVATLACPAVAYLLAAAGLTFFTLRLPAVRTLRIEEVSQPLAAVAAAPVEAAIANGSAAVPSPEVPPHDASLTGEAGADFARPIAAGPVGPFDSTIATPRGPDESIDVEALPSAGEAAVRLPRARVVVTVRPAIAALVVGVSAAWLLTAFALAVRLLVEHWQLARIRRMAVGADEETRRLHANLARQMNVPAPRLLRSPFVASPCLAGIFRPTVLLPEDLSGAAISAVLVHELAHRKRGDCAWNLLRHLSEALLCPQPLIWRLSRQMEAAAEEVCDDYVVKFGENRRAYAETLVSLAERNLLPASGAVVSLVTFRSLLAKRVKRIMDHSRRLSLAVGLAALSLIVAGGLSAALVAGLLGPGGNAAAAAAESDEKVKSQPADDEQSPAADSESADEDTPTKTIAGHVFLPDNKPAASAHVVLLARERASFRGGQLGQSSEVKVLGRTRCDARGRFELRAGDLSAAPYQWVQLLIRADGSGLAWRDVNADAQQLSFDITLPPAGEARGRLVTSEGRPAAGLTILVNSLGDFSKGQVSGVDSMRAALPPDVWPRDVVTDAEGRFAVTGIASGVDVSLYAAQEPFAPHWWIWKTADKSDHTEVLSPAQVIKGVVVAADTGKPLAHARLTAFQGWDPKRGGMTGVDGQADADGRFRLNPFAAGSYVVSAFAPDGLPYLARKMEFEWPAAAAEHELRVELSRGVLVHGKIVEEVSGQPIAGASVRYEPRVLNQRDTDDLVTGWQATSVSDDGGNYAIAVPPGPGYITVLCPGGRYVVQPTTNSFLREGKPGGRRVYLHAYKTFDLEPDAKEQIFDLKVTRGSTVDTHVVGPDGKIPERLLMIYQGLQAPWSESFGDNPQVVPGGRVEIGSVPPDGELTVYLLDPVRKNGRVVNLRGKDAGKPQNIELLPCGSASLRFVDGKGNPVPGVDKLGLNMVFTPGTTVFEMTAEKPMADETYVANFDRLNHWHLIGEGGLIDYQALIPGVDYQLFGSDASGKPGVERVFRVQPGEHQQLKDYVIRDQDVLDRAEDVWREKQKAKAAEQEQALNDKSPPDDDLLVVRGQVVDPAGKPFVGADVVAVRWYWQNQDPGVPLAKTTSNAAGEFEISFRKSQFDVQANNPHQWRYASIAATAPGHGVGWIFYNDVEPGQRATLKLVEDQPITGRIVDLEGNPVAGATLHIQSIYRNDNDDLSRWIDALRGGISYFGSEDFDRPDRALPTASFEFCKPVRTDEDGRFRVSGFGRSRYVSLNLIGPRIAVSDLRVVSAPVEPFVVDYGDNSQKRTQICYGSDFQHSAEPSQPIEGVVRDARSKQPLPGVRVVADRLAGTNLNGVYATETLSDAEGRYRLDGMPKGEGNGILAIPGDDQPYFMREIEVPTAPGFEPVKFDIELHRGIWITGRLSEKDTAAPIQARMHYLPWPDNPHIKDLPEFNDGHLQGSQMRYEAGGDGRFKLVGLPGRGLVAAVCTKKPYPPGQGVREIADLPKRDQFRKVVGVFAPTELFPTAVHEIRPAEDAAEIDVDFRLDPGARLKVRFVDPRGNPLTNLWIRGLWPRTPVYVAENAGPEAEVLALRPDEKRLLLVLDKERHLGKAVEVSLADAKDGLLTIPLEPCATVKARLLDQNGEPARGATVRIVPTSENDFSVDLPEVATDENGILNNAAVPSGCRYRISCSSPEIEYQTVAKDLAVAAGETVDLGEFDVTSEERPEPKRTAAAAVPAGEQPATTESKPDETVVVRGRVVDPAGKPVAGADVWAIHPRREDESKQPPARTQTDATGQFVLRFTGLPADGENREAWRKPRTVASAHGFGPAWMEYDESQGDKPVTLRLVTDEPIVGRVVDLEGRPVAGALVTVRAISRNESEDLTTWLDALRKGETYRSATYVNTEGFGAPQNELFGDGPQVFQTVKTDADGAFRVAGVGRQRRASLRLSGPGVVSADLEAVTVPMDALTVRFGNPEPYFDRDVTVFGAKFQYAAEPSPPIVGKVVDAKTRAPLAGVRLVAKKFAGKRMSEHGHSPVVSDEQGAFRLDGMPRGEGNIILVSPAVGQPYFARELEVPVARSDLEAVQFDVELHRGVMIHGRVTNKATGQPVDARVRYVPWPDNPHLEATQFKGRMNNPSYPHTDRDGRFELVGMPGRGLIYIECRDEPFPAGQGLTSLGDTPHDAFRDVSGGQMLSESNPTAVHKVEIREDQTEIATEIALESGTSVDLRVVDSQGQPLTGLNVRGLWPLAAGYRGTDLGSDFQVRALKPNEKRWVLLHHPAKNLGRALEIDSASAGAGPVQVVLEPCGTVTARLLDQDGEPVRNGYVSFGIPQTENWALELTEAQTDQNGVLRSKAILPGGRYDVSVASPRTNWQSVAKGLTIAPGETVDLGEFDVTSDERPEPKRTPAKPPGREAAAPSAAPEANALVIRGTVLDPEGKPVVGVVVRCELIDTSNIFNEKSMRTGQTDAAGRFAIDTGKSRDAVKNWPGSWPLAMTTASAPGYGPAWLLHKKNDIEREFTLRLVADQPIEGRIVDLEAQPMAGVDVQVVTIETNESENLAPWLEAMRDGASYQAAAAKGQPDLRLGMTSYGRTSGTDLVNIHAKTGAEGRFRLDGVGRGRLAYLRISGGGIVAGNLWVVSQPMEPIRVEMGSGTIPDLRNFFGATFEYVAEHSPPIEGVVRDANSGKPLAGVHILSDQFAGTRLRSHYVVETVSGADGRYRLEGMPHGAGNRILAMPALDLPYLMREFEVPGGEPFQPVKFDVELHRGVWIEGRVTDQKTGQPVSGQVSYLPWPDNPNLEGVTELTSRNLPGPQDHYRADADGRYRLVGLPGRGLVVFWRQLNLGAPATYPNGQGIDEIADLPSDEAFKKTSFITPRSAFVTALKEVEAEAGDAATVADFALRAGDRIAVRIFDPERKPIGGVRVRGLWPIGQMNDTENLGPTVEVAGLAEGETRQLLLEDAKRRLGKGIKLSLASQGAGPVDIQLEPFSTVTARLLDKDGEPIRNVLVSFQYRAGPNFADRLGDTHTDADGRFTHDAVPPGVEFSVRCESPLVGFRTLAEKLTVAAGEKVDLGEINVFSETRPEPKRTTATQTAGEANAPAGTIAMVIHGTVLDPDGNPLAGADVKLIRTPRAPWAKGFPTPEATSDKEGRFAFELPKSRYEGLRTTRPWPFSMIVATAPGYAPSFAPYEADGAGTEPVIRLAANAPIEGRIVDLEGRPVPHVRVRVTGISTNVKSDPTAWLEALRAGTPHRAVPHEHRLNMGLSSDVDQPGNKTETDDDGRFHITAVGRGRLATLSISGGGIVATNVDVVNWPMEPLTTNVAEAGTITKTFYGSKFQIAAEPSQPIEGVVRDAKSGQPLSGIRIHGRRMAGKRWAGYPPPEAVSDEQARYRLEGMPKGEGNTLEAVPADGQPYFMREFDVPTAREFEPVKFDLELHRGILIHGRVRDKVTGEPVKAKVLYLPWPDNPNIKGLVEFTSGVLMGDEDRYRTDDEGRFALVGLPGRGLLSVIHVDDQPYPTGQGFDLLPDLEANRLGFRQISQLYVPDAKWMVAIKEIRPAEGDAEFTADIELVSGETVKLRVVDEAGQPVSGVTAAGIWPNRMSHIELKTGPEIEAVALKPGEKRWVTCCHIERNLGRVVRVSIGDDKEGPVPIVLQPCAAIQGRLVDEDGKPLEGVQVSFHIAGERYGTAAAGPVHTDKDGRFVNKSIFPGTAYDVTWEDDESRDRSIAKKLAVAPGETIDLGQLDVTAEERPAPKRTPAKQLSAITKNESPPSETGGAAAADEPFQFAGKVVGPDDKPLAGAKIFVLYYTPNRIETKPRAQSNADGSFEFAMTKQDFDTGEMNAPWEGATAVAVAPGYGAAWALAAGLEKSGQMMKTLRAKRNFSPARAHISTDSTLRLVADDVPIEGRIVNLEGQPVAGADLQVIELHGDTENSLDAWLDAVQNKNASFYEAREHLFGGFSGTHAQHQLAQLFPKVVTDAEGRFHIRGVGRERIVMLQIAGRAIETRQIFARTRPGPTFHLLRERDNPDFGKFTYYGAKLDLVAAPSRDVVGVVRDKDTGQPLAGATIEAEVLAGEPVSGWTNAYVRTATDAQGRYRLSGLPIGENRIMALPPPSEPHMPSRSPAVTSLNEESITVDFELKRGVWIRGRVTDGASGEPLRAWVDYFAFLDNPNLKAASDLSGVQLVKIVTDADGRFAVRGLPGRGMVGVLALHHEEYPRGVGAEKITDGRDANSAADSGTVTFRTEPHPCFATNFHALAEVNPAQDADAVEVDFALRDGPRIEGTVLDPSGKPLSGAMFAGENQMLAWRLPPLEGPSFTVRNLEPNKPRRLHFYHTDRQLAGSMLLEGHETGPLSVRLEPWGTVTGRVLQSNGEPADKLTLLGALFSGQPPAAPGLLPDPHNRQTDDEGRFKIEGLAAGIPYALSASRRGTILGTVIEELQVAAGETKDLGDLTIHWSSDKSKAKAATERKGGRAAAAADTSAPFQFAGNVVDPAGKPLAGAKIHIVYYTPNGIATNPRAETKADGSFEFTMSEQDFDAGFSDDPWKYAMLAAVAPPYGLGWAHAAAAEKTGRILAAVRASPNYRPDRLQDPSDSTIRLVADDVPIEGRIINLEGQGVAGAKVYVIELHANRENNLDGWLDAVENKKADYYQARQLVQGGFHGLFMQQQLAQLFPPVTSDAEGRFRIQGIGRERIAHLQIEPPECETQRVYARTRPGPALYVTEEADRSDDWPKLTYYGAQFDYAAAPSRAVVGVVRDKDTGKPLANVGVHSEKIAGHELQGWSQRYIQTTSDAEGRYRLEGLPIGSNRLIAIPRNGEPYLCIEATVETTPAAESAALDFELKRGVWIRGKVTDAASGEPLRASVEYFAFDANPHLRPDGKRINFENPIHHSNGEGQFAILGLPGRGMITAMANNAEDYPRGAGAEKIEGGRVDGRDEMFRTWPHHAMAMNANALVEVNPEPGDDAIEQDIVLDPGPRIEGTVLDTEGKPLAGADCAGQHDFGYWRSLSSEKFTVRHLRPDETRRLLFSDKERKLAGTLLVKHGDKGPLTVKLEPAGTVKGRMLSEDGDPADQIFLYPGRAKDVPGVEANTFPDAQHLHTDQDGHFTIPGLAPGVNYSVRASRGNRYLGTAFENVSVAAGETKDLGDVTLRMEPPPSAGKPSEKKSAEQKPAEQKAASKAAPVADARGQIQLAGKVVDPHGRPAAGAKIYLLQDVPAVTKPILMAETKPDGTFALTVAKKDFNTDESSEPWLTAKLIATADGQGMAWALAASFESSGKLLENLPLHPNFSDRRDEVAADKTLHLVADDVPIEGRIIDLEGKTVAGVRVRVVQIDRAAQNNLDPWLEAVQDKDRAFHEAWNIVGISTGFNFQRQLEHFFPGIKTGADGRFRIRGVGRERIALLQMEGPEIETRQVSARTRSGPTVRVSDPRNPQMQARMYHGASFDEVAGPSRPVKGVVRDKDTGQPLAGVQVQAYRLAHIGVQPYPNTLFYTVTDKEGRYELRGLPMGENELLALAPRNEPYLVSAQPAEVNPAADEIVVDFELKRGVWIRGRVTDARSGEPVRATVQYYVFLDNPRGREAPGFSDAFALWFGTDVEGRFEIAGLPGRGIVGVRAKNYSDYPIGVGANDIQGREDRNDFVSFRTAPSFNMARDFHALAEVNPDENGGHNECNFALVPGRAVSGTVLDPKGAPLAGAMIAGAVEAQLWQPLAGASFKVRNLQPEKSRRVQFYHAERRLAGTVLLSGDEKGPLTVKLEPWATITGRVVDAQGDAISDVRVSSAGVLDPQWGILPNRDAFEVDDEGRFTIEGLAPGVPYILGAYTSNRFLGAFIKDLKLAAGETKDLGDVAVKRSND